MDTQNTKENLPNQLPVGTILLDRYEIGHVLGQGGFGITYEGYDNLTKTKVAIKEYFPSGYASRTTENRTVTIISKENLGFIKDGMSRFLEEARMLASCNGYPGVVGVRDFFEENNTAYIVMEFLEGVDFKHRIREKLFEPDELINLMWPVFDALAGIHKLGMIHRDISPDNIMLLNDGRAKLMDFGAAREANLDGERSISIVLKAGYAPGEQYRKKGKQGPWTDIYALCATMYKCITGITPEDSLEREIKDTLKKPSELGFSIDDRLERVLMIGMNVNPEKRFQSVEDMVLALKGESELSAYEDDDDDDDDRTIYYGPDEGAQEVLADTGSAAESKEGGPKSRKLLIIIAAAAAAVILAVIIFAVIRAKSAKESEQPAETQASEETVSPTEDEEEQEETAAVDEHSDMYEIKLVPNDDLTIEGFNNAAQIMEERIKVLCGDEDYYFEIDGQNINIWVPEDTVFDEDDLDSLITAYVANGYEFIFSFWGNHDELPDTSFTITDGMIEDAQVKYGSIPGFDPADEYGTAPADPDNYVYTEITFSQEFWDQYGDYFKDECHDPVIALPNLSGEGMYSWCEAELHYVDERKAAVYSDTSEYRYELGMEPVDAGLFCYNLVNENIDLSFKHEVVWKNIEWTDVADEDEPGAYQCNIEDFTEDYVCLKYQLNAGSGMTEGVRYEFFNTLKTRLDTLEIPYSLGKSFIEASRTEYECLCLAVPFEHMGICVADLALTHNSSFGYCIVSGNYRVEFEAYNATVSFPNYGDSRCMVIQYDDDYIDELETITTYLTDKGVDRLYFVYDNEYICEMPLTGPVTDGILAFTELTHKTEDTKWQWDFIQSLFETEYPIYVSYNGAQFVSIDGTTDPDMSDFEVKPLTDTDEYTSMIQTSAPGAVVRYPTSTNTIKPMFSSEEKYLYVELNLSADTSLPQEAAQRISAILKSMDFVDNAMLRSITFILTKEDDVVGEEAEIEVSKGYNWADLSASDLDYSIEYLDMTVEEYFAENDAGEYTIDIITNVDGGRFEGLSEYVIESLKADEYLGSAPFDIEE